MSRQKLSSAAWLDAAGELRQMLREHRTDHGISQESLARRTGLSLAALRKIEGGQTAEPGFFTVLALARALDIPVSYFDRFQPSREGSEEHPS